MRDNGERCWEEVGLSYHNKVRLNISLGKGKEASDMGRVGYDGI